MFIHADNWCHCDFYEFIDFHMNHRPANTFMTMMTFCSPSPSSCGIVELDERGVVQKFHEKVVNPPGNLANAAIYLLEPEVLDLIQSLQNVFDFDTDVIPYLLGRIATWQNTNIHRDIGTLNSLLKAQDDLVPFIDSANVDTWHKEFEKNNIHNIIKLKQNKY